MADTFVVKYPEFNQLLTDQAPEHVNRISKTVVGSRTRDYSTPESWCLTYNHRSQASGSFKYVH